jgi:O-antigen/teichoic acid export membrane protein
LSRAKHLANVVVGQANTLIAMSGSLIVTPAVLHALGDSAYGGWLLINSFIGYMKFLDLGATAGTVKFAAGAYSRNDKDDLAAVLNTAIAIFLAVAAAVLLGSLALVTVLPRVYPVVAGQGTVIVMLGAAMATEMLFKPFVAALRMRSWYFVYDVIEIGTYTTFKFGLVLYCALVRGLSYQVLAFLTLCETVIRLSLVFVGAMIASPVVRKINPFRARRNMIRKLAGIGVAVSIMMVADIVLFQLDAGVIGWFMPESPQSIAVFGLGARLATIATQVIGVIGGVLIPRFSGLSETGDTEGTRKLLERGSKQIGLGCALVMGNLLVLGPHFLSLWLKKPWAPESGVILLILIPGYWMSLLTMPSKASLYGAAKLRSLTIFIVVEAIVNFVISVALVRPLGIVGVAIGTAVPLFGFHAVLFPILLKHEVGVPVAKFWQMHKTSLAIGAVYLALIGGLAFVPLTTFPRFFLFCAGTVSVFIALVLAGVPEARSEMQKRLARFKRAPKNAPTS